jgi:hypothetical protein
MQLTSNVPVRISLPGQQNRHHFFRVNVARDYKVETFDQNALKKKP